MLLPRHVGALLAATCTLATCTVGCADPDPTSPEPGWIDDVEAAVPASLSEVGLFGDMTTRARADGGLNFAPRFPLYSNGLDKERLLFVPPDALVDGAEAQGWIFPTGTVVAKTFTHLDAPIETRLLFKRTDGWDYALYKWNDARDDAELLAGNWAEEVLALEGGVNHTLPARLDCRTCHETNEDTFGTTVLGLSGYQVQDVDTLPVSGGQRVEVAGQNDAETAALGYFIGNCTTCHNGGDGTNASFDLFPEAAVANLVNQETESETAEGIRVIPGDAENSALFISVVDAAAVDYAGPFKAMPPLGLNMRDPAVGDILRDWIESL